ncbi:hypothetical protein [Phytohabitans aurantiacus]|nr:hypothetical protein [Phytohabitans aurantiacus]
MPKAMTGQPAAELAGLAGRVHLTGKLRLPGMNGEGSIETEGGDQTRILNAVALMIAFGIGMLPATLLGVICYLCPIPIWVKLALPLIIWAITTVTMLILMRKESH